MCMIKKVFWVIDCWNEMSNDGYKDQVSQECEYDEYVKTMIPMVDVYLAMWIILDD